MNIEQLNALIINLSNMTTLLIIIGSFSILALTTAFSGISSGAVRLLFFFGLATACFFLSSSLDGANKDFFLNITTELLGAVLALIFLGGWMTTHSWLFPIAFAGTIFTTLPVELVDPEIQPFFINLSSELVGAFLIVVLLQKRDWLWNVNKSRRDKETLRLRKQQEEAFEKWKQNERAIIRQEMQQELEAWRMKGESWNVALKFASPDKYDARRKLRHIRRSMHQVEVLKVVSDPETKAIQCYLLASLETRGLSAK